MREVERNARRSVRHRFSNNSNFWRFVLQQEPEKIQPYSILERMILLRLDPSRRRRSFLEKKRKIQEGPEKSAYYDKLV